MRVDFYVLGQTPAERIVPALAAKVLGSGDRLLVVSEDEAQLSALSDALWRSDGFLAHGTEHAARQPVLLSDDTTAANGARLVCFADGNWREDDGFERIFYLFGDEAIEDARKVWREMAARDDAEAFFWKQENGKWRQGP